MPLASRSGSVCLFREVPRRLPNRASLAFIHLTPSSAARGGRERRGEFGRRRNGWICCQFLIDTSPGQRVSNQINDLCGSDRPYTSISVSKKAHRPANSDL